MEKMKSFLDLEFSDAFMFAATMEDEERREGRKEGRLEGYKEERGHMMALIQAMCADGKEKELPRISSEPEFLDEMLKRYHIVSGQETVWVQPEKEPAVLLKIYITQVIRPKIHHNKVTVQRAVSHARIYPL